MFSHFFHGRPMVQNEHGEKIEYIICMLLLSNSDNDIYSEIIFSLVNVVCILSSLVLLDVGIYLTY